VRKAKGAQHKTQHICQGGRRRKSSVNGLCAPRFSAYRGMAQNSSTAKRGVAAACHQTALYAKTANI